MAAWAAVLFGLVASLKAISDAQPLVGLGTGLAVLALGVVGAAATGVWRQRKFYAAAEAAGLTRAEAEAIEDEAERLNDE